jgi:uncharacterized repeat protein (TIGR03803 family)
MALQLMAGLIGEEVDGSFLGTTVSGLSGRGTVFLIAADGHSPSFIRSACIADGAQPQAALVRATDGNFYGTTASGGVFNKGTIFRMAPDGTAVLLRTFTGGADGASPLASLIQASDGHLYGTASGSGPFNRGTVFRVTLAGSLTLHGFRR